MLNKVQMMALNDFIEDKSSINLKLFILAVNPSAQAKPGLLKALIERYEKDKSKQRLQAIELYLLGDSKPAKKQKAQPKISYLPAVVVNNPEKVQELAVLRRKFQANMSRQGSTAAATENEDLRKQIDEIESDLGLKYEYDRIPPEADLESKRSLVLGVLGDYNDQQSIAHELLYGQRQYFEVSDSGRQNTSGLGMTALLETLQKISGKPIRPFNVQFVFPQGQAGAKAKWVFSLQPQMSTSQMITNVLQKEGTLYDVAIKPE